MSRRDRVHDDLSSICACDLSCQMLKVAGGVNGRLFEALLGASAYDDVRAAQLFNVGPLGQHVIMFVHNHALIAGADIVGDMEYHGLGDEVHAVTGKSAETLWDNRQQHNAALVSKLKEDEASEWVMQHTKEEARLGRTSWPKCGRDLGSALLLPRFAVQQVKVDGTVKYRAIDHGSWAPGKEGRQESVNGHTSIADSICHHTLDNLGAALVAYFACTGEVPHLYKADIDAAFRRIPVRSDHRRFCGIAFKYNGEVPASCLRDCCQTVCGCCRYIQRCTMRALWD